MYIIIVGAGVVGSRMASMLANERHEVVVVDLAEAALDNISLRLDVKTVHGSGISPKVMSEAGVSEADIVVAATNQDEQNIISCFVSKQLGAKKTVARIQNPDYPAYFVVPTAASSPTKARRVVSPKKLGVDLIVNPEVLAAEHIVETLSGLFLMPVKNLADGLLQIAEFEVEREIITNIALSNMDFSRPVRIAAILRNGKTVIPTGDEKLQLDDHVFFVTAKENTDIIGKMFSEPRDPTRKVIIFGGGSIGFRVAEQLEQQGAQVKIIERSLERCQRISKLLDRTMVVHGEITSEDYLRSEGISSVDAFVAAAESDELNVLISLLAKKLGASRSFAVINQTEYMVLAEDIGVDVVVSPLLLAGNEFARFIHAATVLSAASFAAGSIEAIEYSAESDSSVIHRQVKEIEQIKKMVVGAIVRQNRVIIPEPEERIVEGDRVILVGLHESMGGMDKLFEIK